VSAGSWFPAQDKVPRYPAHVRGEKDYHQAKGRPLQHHTNLSQTQYSPLAIKKVKLSLGTLLKK